MPPTLYHALVLGPAVLSTCITVHDLVWPLLCMAALVRMCIMGQLVSLHHIPEMNACSAAAVQGQPWVRMCVVGQSFMLHQIRKMVGLAVAVFRGAAPEDAISMALQADRWALPVMSQPCGRSWGRCNDLGPPSIAGHDG